ncbi:MAG: hypothetical protein LBH25_06815 [Fibromonadaceae bacterium]|jgi:hypothetical protein|nr:hypothetical protein [Fibromonadaceae bacterium]
MNQKNMFIASIALNIGLIILVFVVKNSATSQAQEFVKKTLEKNNHQIAQVKDNLENNNLLWTLIDSTWKSPDKSKASVIKMAKAQTLPRCKGKPCKPCSGSETEGCLNVAPDKESVKVGWSKYYFKVLYDNKDKFSTIDASDLLGKSLPDSGGEEEEEVAE